MRWIEQLLNRYERAHTWPLKHDRQRWTDVAKWIAFRENDREQLAKLHDDWPDDRRYRIDPLAPLISSSFGSLVIGQQVGFEAAEPDDQERLDFIVEENEMSAELQRMTQTRSSEGEVWWRIYVDREAADAPLVAWHSRAGVSPLWTGHKLRAVAFVSRLDPLDENDRNIWRHLELHDDEDVQNALFLSQSESSLGRQVDLTEHPETRELREEPWQHGLGTMLAGWIPNLVGADPHRGYSDYEPVEDFLLELNESLAVAHENMKLTAKRRIVVPRSAIDPETGRPVGVDSEFLIADEGENRNLGEGAGKGPWQVLEYEFDAEAMGKYRKDLAVDALGRIGITAQFVGQATDNSEGYATSGVALRLRLMPSVNAGNDRAQPVDGRVPAIIELLQRVDEMAFDEGANTGGFGRSWRDSGAAPSVDRGAALPEDETEQSARLATEVEARLLSRRTAIEERHPNWAPERVIEELRRIAVDADGVTYEAATTLYPDPDSPPPATDAADDEEAAPGEDDEEQDEDADVG